MRTEYDNEYALLMARTIMDFRDRDKNCEVGSSFAETYSLNTGIKKLGERGYNAAFDEVNQLHQRGCFQPIDVNLLAPEERKKALESLIFLTEKRDGRAKARTCADGRKQRLWMDKNEAASPTVLLESVMITSTIDAKENRDGDCRHSECVHPNGYGRRRKSCDEVARTACGVAGEGSAGSISELRD